MRLAVFTNQFPSSVSTFFARDMRGLIEAGVSIDVFPINPLNPEFWRYVPDILNENVLPRSQVKHLSTREMILSGRSQPLNNRRSVLRDVVPILRSAAHYGAGPFGKTLYSLIKGYAAAQRYIANYDHILAYWGSYAATYAYVYHRITNGAVPFSMFLHAGDLYQDQVYLDKKLQYADNIFVVCEFNRRYLQEHYGNIFELISNKIHIYHPSLNFAELPFCPDRSNATKLLGVGRFDKCKGYDFLLRAVHRLMEAGISTELELIGDGDEAGSLRSLAAQLGMEKQVFFRGWLPFDEVKRAMTSAAVLVHPSSELGDAVPTVIKEAIALGTPVVATNVAGIPELLDGGRCGILVEPQDVQSLADGIQAMLVNPSERREYADRARKFAEETFDVWRNGRRLAHQLQSTSRVQPEIGTGKRTMRVMTTNL